MDRPVALVTGASRGIGLAVARELGSTHHVLVGGRDADAVARAVAELPSAEAFVADLGDTASVAAALAGVAALDVVVHSAGIQRGGTVEELTRADWEDVLRTNVVAVADLTRQLLPLLRSRQGMVVTINSGSGYRAGLGASVYSASKFALRAFTDTLREEERGRLRVVSIHPGRVATDMQREMWAAAGSDYDPGDHLDPADVARTVRLAVDMPAHANVDELSVRPAVQRNP